MRTPSSTTRAVLALFLTIAALGAGSPAHAQAPPEAAAPDQWRSAAAGAHHTCAIRPNGRLHCWGSNSHGQLGTGGVAGGWSPDPLRVDAADAWLAVSAGTMNTCAIRVDHRLFCWGDDDAGQVGDGAERADVTAPHEVAGGGTNWSAVTLGEFHTCGLRSGGALFCWGNDAYGQVGDGGQPVDRPTPVRVPGRYRSVDAGPYHTCAITHRGAVRCWGDDADGQLGNGSAVGGANAPVSVAGRSRVWTQISAGGQHTCALTSGGRGFCWGDDSQGQLGNGFPADTRQAPVPVDTNERYSAVSAGIVHTCARSVNGEARCWGGDGTGQLGNGPDQAGTTEPNGVLTPTSTMVTAGSFHSCSRTTGGRLQCWGDNTKGQVGTRVDPLVVQTPVGVVIRPA